MLLPKEITRLLFISTNREWGGSEILWTKAALRCQNRGIEIFVAAQLPKKQLVTVGLMEENILLLSERWLWPSLPVKLVQRLRYGKYRPRDRLKLLLEQHRPDVVLINQGNNTAGLQFMQLCHEAGVPYATLTQLVSEFFWLGINQKNVESYRRLYQNAKKNFFVANHNLRLHEEMLGQPLSNAEVVFNPFSPPAKEVLFPPVHEEIFKVAVVCRIEFFHKGLDLLLQVICQDKWKQRSIEFHFFGSGPHQQLLSDAIVRYELKQAFAHGHANHVAAIWEQCHLLVMPSRMEGQSLALIEAMHFNRAAVVTNVGGANELIQEGVTGFIAPHPNTEAIDAALDRAWTQREHWEKMGLQAGAFIRATYPPDQAGYFVERLLQS